MFGATTSMQSCLVLPLVEGFNNSTQPTKNFDETSDAFKSIEEFFCVEELRSPSCQYGMSLELAAQVSAPALNQSLITQLLTTKSFGLRRTRVQNGL